MSMKSIVTFLPRQLADLEERDAGSHQAKKKEKSNVNSQDRRQAGYRVKLVLHMIVKLLTTYGKGYKPGINPLNIYNL